MAKNSFFRHNTVEQNLINSLTIEAIKIYGEDMIYIPRVYVNTDELFGEDLLSNFTEGNNLEMYIESVDGFAGEGDFMAKFGLEIRDSVTLIVSKQRFEQTMAHDADINRPREGDLIYFPLSKSLFEIKFVEHENPFYQLGSLFVYKLTCDLFKYSHETIDTGFTDIDIVESERSVHSTNLILGTMLSTGSEFVVGETIYQVSGIPGGSLANASSVSKVIAWDNVNKTLETSSITGTNTTFSTGTSVDSIIGGSSGVEYLITSSSVSPAIIPTDLSTNPMGDNEPIELDADTNNIFNFTDTDPWSEGTIS